MERAKSKDGCAGVVPKGVPVYDGKYIHTFLPLYFCEASILQRSQAQNYYCYNSIFRVEGGQSVTLVGSKLITSGGEDKHLILLNDVNSFDLETMIWNVAETTQVDLYNILATSGIFMGIAIVLWTMYVWLCA
ncbi:putative kelch-type beta propeller [Helianthus annuus]|uniref:Kelch-type beta propeller n=1 Tax=Helianthus annuus TaxID=4232 RepID=A0A9K3NBH0_HELAN|nr:putative kelch-type beta propeller [Helianthus annuus]